MKPSQCQARLSAGRFGSIASVIAALVLFPSSAAAATTTVKLTSVGETPFIVPAGVHSVSVALTGAPGGWGGNGLGYLAPGGQGGRVHATLAVTPGEVLFAEVGGAGGNGHSVAQGSGGVNGGGAGGGHGQAGGGGGATDIRTCSKGAGNPLNPLTCTGLSTLHSRLVVAGGGGGGGNQSTASGFISGGGGGAAGGGGGSGDTRTSGAEGGHGGGPGTLSAGGGRGDTSGSTVAQPGRLGAGGNGGDENSDDFGGGGGGGGGLFGGGGGGGGNCLDPHLCGGGGGGGGGSSGVPAGAVGVNGASTGIAAVGATPAVIFTWVLPPPTVITGAVGNVGVTKARLTGVVDPNGSQITSCHFTITPAPPSGGSVKCSPMPGTGNTPVAVAAPITGLAHATKYTVQLVAASAQGVTHGHSVKFTTRS